MGWGGGGSVLHYMPCQPVNNYCFGSSEDEKSNNAEEMSALNVDIETSETKNRQ